MAVLAGIVLVVSLTVLRPVVARAVVDWASDNPSALGLPFVKELVREDLGQAMTEAASRRRRPGRVHRGRGRYRRDDRRTRSRTQGFLHDARAFVFISTDANWPTSSRPGPTSCAGT